MDYAKTTHQPEGFKNDLSLLPMSNIQSLDFISAQKNAVPTNTVFKRLNLKFLSSFPRINMLKGQSLKICGLKY